MDEREEEKFETLESRSFQKRGSPIRRRRGKRKKGKRKPNGSPRRSGQGRRWLFSVGTPPQAAEEGHRHGDGQRACIGISSYSISASIVRRRRAGMRTGGRCTIAVRTGAWLMNSRVASFFASGDGRNVVTDPGNGPHDERLFLTSLAPFTKKIGTD